MVTECLYPEVQFPTHLATNYDNIQPKVSGHPATFDMPPGVRFLRRMTACSSTGWISYLTFILRMDWP